MRQRYTIDLQRIRIQTATIDVVANTLNEAQDKALEMAARVAFPWSVDHQGARVTKVVCHAGEVPDESH